MANNLWLKHNSIDNITVDSLMQFINIDTVLMDDDKLKSLTTVDISKKYDNDGKTFYLVTTIQQQMWSCDLYMINIYDNKITNLEHTGLGGNYSYFSYDIVNISQGNFISAFCSSHSGNGNLEFMEISKPNIIKYSIPNAVDANYEENGLAAIENNLLSDNQNKFSSVYLGGKLNVEYKDVDNDGNTDIILTGIQQIYMVGDNDEQILIKEYYIIYIYIYDLIKDDFIFCDSMSKKILINA